MAIFEIAKKIFREIYLFDFTSFFALDFFTFSGPLCIVRQALVLLLIFQKEERPDRKIAKNPYKFGKTTTESITQQKSIDKEAESVLQKVSGLGEKKASILVKHFPTLRDLLEADQSQLSQVIGQSSASTVWNFFNPKNS